MYRSIFILLLFQSVLSTNGVAAASLTIDQFIDKLQKLITDESEVVQEFQHYDNMTFRENCDEFNLFIGNVTDIDSISIVKWPNFDAPCWIMHDQRAGYISLQFYRYMDVKDNYNMYIVSRAIQMAIPINLSDNLTTNETIANTKTLVDLALLGFEDQQLFEGYIATQYKFGIPYQVRRHSNDHSFDYIFWSTFFTALIVFTIIFLFQLWWERRTVKPAASEYENTMKKPNSKTSVSRSAPVSDDDQELDITFPPAWMSDAEAAKASTIALPGLALAQPTPAQPSPPQPNPAQPSPAQPSPAQPSSTQPSPAQLNAAQPSPA
ncbi:unnamed protein product [Bursaphelenchus okinawaensis]|uniref:Signal sequence receptor subunit alpha n=1 Tax=Bursaphelenchus okinawaensis TaxID=465554 RepID=A0A811JWD4_9BILA|nr:unnamed protein product [Bursaphelenchus okinawaensis]CAG9086016.1 unnamed protein product [Bursaphelenchus okinawaensis]